MTHEQASELARAIYTELYGDSDSKAMREELQTAIYDWLITGDWRDGEPLPSVAQLAADWRDYDEQEQEGEQS